MISSMTAFLIRAIVTRYHPRIIGVVGTVGKSTTVAALTAIYTATGKRVRCTESRYGDAWDTACAVAGCGRDSGWAIFWRAARLLLLPRSRTYPDVLLLEYGLRVPGALKQSLDLVTPQIVAITSVAPIGVEAFGTTEKTVREAGQAVKAVPEHGAVVVSCDDARVCMLEEKTRAHVLTYGIMEGVDVRAIEIQTMQQRDGAAIVIDGTHCKLSYQGSAVPIFLPGVLGGPHVHAALAATAVALSDGMNLVAISEGLRGYAPLPGRMRLLRGVKQTLLVDDTYDASHVSCIAALSAGIQIRVEQPQESFAVLGDMMHVGERERSDHWNALGTMIHESGLDYLVTVGAEARFVGKAARAAGMAEDRVYAFDSVLETGKFLQQRIEEGDVIFITGKKSMRMEKIVRELLANPQEADRVLVRRR